MHLKKPKSRYKEDKKNNSRSINKIVGTEKYIWIKSFEILKPKITKFEH